MTVLVGYASLHWSTKGIAQQIGDRLMKAGFKVVVRPLGEIDRVLQYEAIVLGSAAPDQAWLAQGTEFLTRHATDLARLRVWLFNVNPPEKTPIRAGAAPSRSACDSRNNIQAYLAAHQIIQPRAQPHFTAVTEPGEWERVSNLFLKVCGGHPDDRRSWREVDAWAASIARVLQSFDQLKERRRLHLMVRGKP